VRQRCGASKRRPVQLCRHSFAWKHLPGRTASPPEHRDVGAATGNFTTGDYVGLAATGVLLTGAVVTGVFAHGKKTELERANDTRHV